MKDIEFLKQNNFCNNGLYDNKSIYENTLESFNEAINNGLGIYITVQSTKDGKLIVYSDQDLSKFSVKDRIIDTSYEEISYISFYHIPLIDEVLNLINGKVPVIINPKNLDFKYYTQKELVKYLDNYNGKFAILNNNAMIIRWFNNNRPDYVIGEILTKKRVSFNSFKNFLANYSIISDFKSINIEYYDIYKIKELKENNLIIGYLIDSEEKYNTYKDDFDNLIISNIKSENMIK